MQHATIGYNVRNLLEGGDCAAITIVFPFSTFGYIVKLSAVFGNVNGLEGSYFFLGFSHFGSPYLFFIK